MLTGRRPREVLTIRTAKAFGAALEREDFGAALEREEEKNEVDGVLTIVVFLPTLSIARG